MKLFLKPILIIVFAITTIFSDAQNNKTFKSKIIYKTDQLIITQISTNAFVHTSFLQTHDFGYVPCNGLIVRNNNESFIFDTPTNDHASEELIKWINETLKCKINGIIPTHFHDDCLGGLKAFHLHQIASYANSKTIEFATEKNYEIPKIGFNDSIKLNVGNEIITAKFFGEGHTKDNVVGYFPSENVMFGGCLLKELHASKGYLGDANVAEWSNTVEKVKLAYPSVSIVVPGHGKFGNKKLLDYTIELFLK